MKLKDKRFRQLDRTWISGLFLLVYFLPSFSAKVVYEGYLSNRIISDTTFWVDPEINRLEPIWLELVGPSLYDTTVSGCCIYRTGGRKVVLEGGEKGKQIILAERGNEPENRTWILQNFGDSIIGKRVGALESVAMSFITLYLADPGDSTIIIWNAKKLKLLEKTDNGGETLEDELEEGRDHGVENNDERPVAEVSFFRKGILSVNYTNWMISAYESRWTRYHTFDLRSMQEIRLLNEFDEEKEKKFRLAINRELQPQLNAFRIDLEQRLKSDSGYFKYSAPDSIWLEELLLADTQEKLIGELPNNEDWTDSVFWAYRYRRVFTVNDEMIMRSLKADDSNMHLYLGENGMHLSVQGYYGLSHAVLCYEFYSDVVLPYHLVRPIIKSESFLHRCFPK